MVLQSLDDFADVDDGYISDDPPEAEEQPEALNQMVDGADAILLEDTARNERQARRNTRIRGLLKNWRDNESLGSFWSVSGPRHTKA